MLIFKSIGRGPGSLAVALREARCLVGMLEDPETLTGLIEATPHATTGLCQCSPHNRYHTAITFDERGRLTITVEEYYEDATET